MRAPTGRPTRRFFVPFLFLSGYSGLTGRMALNRSGMMQDNNRRFADDMAQLDAELGRAIDQGGLATTGEQDRFLGEDSALLRGLLAGMTFAGAPGRR